MFGRDALYLFIFQKMMMQVCADNKKRVMPMCAEPHNHCEGGLNSPGEVDQ